jgi:hypothetical protein
MMNTSLWSSVGKYWYLPIAILFGFLFIMLGAQLSPMIALAIVIAIVVFSFVIARPVLGLLAIAALTPIERFGRLTDDDSQVTISIIRFTGLAVLGVLVLHRLLGRQIFRVDKGFILYFGYVAMTLLSITYTTDPFGTLRAAGAILGNLMFYFLVTNLTSNHTQIRQCLIVWLTVSVGIAIYSLYDWHFWHGTLELAATPDEFDRGKGVQTTQSRWSTVWADQAEREFLGGLSLRRSMGSTSHAAVYGINLILTIPFLFVMLKLYRHWWQQGVIYLALGLVAYNCLLTNTRAVILLAALVVFYAIYRGLYRIYLIQVYIGLFSIPFLYFLVPKDVTNRILDLQNYTFDKSASLQIRLDYFMAGARAFLDHWLIGSGVSNQNVIPAYLISRFDAPEQTTVHNEYLQTLVEVGLVGAFFQFGFVILLLVYNSRTIRILARHASYATELMIANAIRVAMMAVLVYGIQVDVLHFPLKGWWLLAGFTVVMYGLAQEIEQKNTSLNTQGERT